MKTTRSKISIGDLDRRIILQSFNASINTLTNEEKANWQTEKEVWAKVEFPKGDEKELLYQERSIINIIFTVRYDPQFLKRRNRIIHSGRSFDIESHNELGRRDFLKIYCKTHE